MAKTAFIQALFCLRLLRTRHPPVLYNAFNMRPVDIDIVKRLLAAGSNPNETSELLKWEPFESLSPLHVACLEGNLVLVSGATLI